MAEGRNPPVLTISTSPRWRAPAATIAPSETQVYTYKDPMVLEDTKVKMVARRIDTNTHVLESFTIGEDGKDFKNMEITYTRV